jgi:hypothetical protein
MVQRIRDIKTSYPSAYIKSQWDDLFLRRDKMLRNSDWIVLPDSNLTDECIERWTLWRKSLKSITIEKFPKIGDAINMLNDLVLIKPQIIEKKEDENMKEFEAKYIQTEKELKETKEYIKTLEKDISHLANAIIKLEEKIKIKKKIPTDIKKIKDILYNVIKQQYKDNIEEYLEVPIPIVIERCEQAIEYKVKKDVDRIPLIRKYAELYGMKLDEVCEHFIEDKKKLMKQISELDSMRWNLETKVKFTDDIKTLKKILQELEK